jgi:3-dehydroquinate synthase
MKQPNTNVLNVSLGDRSYEIHIAPGGLKTSGSLMKKACPAARRLLLVSNNKVFGLYGSVLMRSLQAAGFRVETFMIGDGERFKSLKTAEKVLSFLIASGFERNDAIVGFGGGVIGDLSGFVAALYLRGIDYIQIPTTLLAQIDSSVGGKTAVNHKLGKNLIGAFYQPRLVIIDPETLTTLPEREMTAGLCEAIKYGVIRDRPLFDLMESKIESLKTFEMNVLVPMIRRCCEIKAEVVSKDERESGLRMILNFGHTVGHALEAVTAYRRFKHGEAVGYGMIAASRIALKVNGFEPAEADRIAALIHASGQLPRLTNIDPDETFRAMSHDKKMSRGKLSFILPDSIGDVVIRRDVSPRIITETIRKMIAAG